MPTLPADRERGVKHELVELTRGPLLVAPVAGIGFEAISHLFQILFVVATFGGVGTLATLAMRGRERYPAVYRIVFPNSRVAVRPVRSAGDQSKR